MAKLSGRKTGKKDKQTPEMYYRPPKQALSFPGIVHMLNNISQCSIYFNRK
jgi:hypothetical protein